jgi:hypothetical protein
MKSGKAPILKTTITKAGTGEASQGDVTFNHRSYAGINDYGAVNRLKGGFGTSPDYGQIPATVRKPTSKMDEE